MEYNTHARSVSNSGKIRSINNALVTLILIMKSKSPPYVSIHIHGVLVLLGNGRIRPTRVYFGLMRLDLRFLESFSAAVHTVSAVTPAPRSRARIGFEMDVDIATAD